jgi:hypothetical protein
MLLGLAGVAGIGLPGALDIIWAEVVGIACCVA